MNLTTRIRLSPGVSWAHQGDQIFVYGDEVLALRDVTPDLVAMMTALDAGTVMAEAQTIGGAEAAEVLELFAKLSYLVPAPSRDWSDTRLDRQVSWLSAMGFDTDTAQRNLCNATVAILGVGGVGTVVLQHLIGAGVGRFALIDSDRVEASNFNRQPIFYPAQIGMPKVQAAAAHVTQHAPQAQVTTHDCEISGPTDLIRLMQDGPAPWDCLVIAADRPADLIERAVVPFCELSGVPALGSACGLRSARWGPLITGNTAPAPQQQPDLPPPAPRAMAASFGPTNAIVSGFLAKDIITLLAGGTPDCARAVMVIDFANLAIKTIPLPGHPDAD